MPPAAGLFVLFIGSIGAAAGVTSSPAAMLAMASLAAAALLLARVLVHRVHSPTADGTNVRWIRRRAECAPFLRLRDPDAAGRPRPRAPTASPRAA